VDLADRGVRHEFNIPDTLIQFVEHDATAAEQHIRVGCRFSPARTAIQQANAQRALEIRDAF